MPKLILTVYTLIAWGCCYCFHTADSPYMHQFKQFFLHTSSSNFPVLGFLHVSEADSPAADATSDSGPDHLPPAPRQSAQCSAVRGGPAGRRSHPGRKDTETDQGLKFISTVRIHWVATKKHIFDVWSLFSR